MGLDRGYAKSGDADIGQALNAVELSGAADAKVKDLSKGMQQRLSMAQALLGNSDIFILDEPMSGLDPLGRRLFREILLALAQEGKTIFFSTHILDDVESVCSHVGGCCLRAGLSIRAAFAASLTRPGRNRLCCYRPWRFRKKNTRIYGVRGNKKNRRQRHY